MTPASRATLTGWSSTSIPGPGVTLADCAQVAFWVREILADVGLDAVPVTSGSKGIHLYVGLDRRRDSSGEVSAVALQIAQVIETDHPDLVTSKMSKALRPGKVFIDWSQNNGNKTTIAPYSLRGRARPTVAAPRTWDELADPDLVHLEYAEVLQRLADGPDPMAALGVPLESPDSPADRDSGGSPVDHEKLHATRRQNLATRRNSGAVSHDQPESRDHRQPEAATGAGDGQDRLGSYRAKRSADRTPEPVPRAGPQPHGDDDTFVIQEHHARRLHWDLRLERNGVLVSWAVPRGIPDTTASEPARRADRGPPAGVRGVLRHHPGRRVRRRRHDHLGRRHLRDREVVERRGHRPVQRTTGRRAATCWCAPTVRTGCCIG